MSQFRAENYLPGFSVNLAGKRAETDGIGVDTHPRNCLRVGYFKSPCDNKATIDCVVQLLIGFWYEETLVMQKLKNPVKQQKRRLRGSVFVEYIILVTIVGIGVIVGLATVREALVNELFDLAAAINAIVC